MKAQEIKAKFNALSQEEQISQVYDRIVSVVVKQGRLLSKKEHYGDGSSFGFNYKLFEAVYDAINEKCSTCNGSGGVQVGPEEYSTCPDCK